MKSITTKVLISKTVSATVTVAQEGDIITATVGRKSALSVLATVAPEKLIARRDKARADLSAVEVDECDGYSAKARSLASQVEEAQIVAILRFLGVSGDTPDACAVASVTWYAERVAGDNALAAPRAKAQAILAALATASRDDVFALLQQAETLYQSAWVNPIWEADQAVLLAAKVAAEKARVDALPDDTSWGYAHGGTD